MTALLRITGLHLDARTARGTAHILRGIDLDVARGRIVGVVGESGSGKSTLALALLRLLPGNVTRLQGQATMDGTDLLALPEAAMDAWRGSRIAMIFQDPATALNPLLTVGTQLADVLRRRAPGLSRAALRTQAEAALRRVEIADPARRLRAYPHELSGGMRQRVMIAMALLARPALLLADEPVSALDPTLADATLRELVAQSDESGATFVASLHAVDLALRWFPRIVGMREGRVVFDKPAAEVTQDMLSALYANEHVAQDAGDDAAPMHLAVGRA